MHTQGRTYYTKLTYIRVYMYVLSLVLVYILYIHDSNTLYMFHNNRGDNDLRLIDGRTENADVTITMCHVNAKR